MTHQEYPKCLIRGDEYVIVFDAQEEMLKRAEGYAQYGEQAKRRTRKAKQ